VILIDNNDNDNNIDNTVFT